MIRELFLNSLYQRPIGASKTEPLVTQYDGPAPVMCDWDERALLFCDMSTFPRPTLCDVEVTPALCNGLRMKRLHDRGAATREIASIKDH